MGRVKLDCQLDEIVDHAVKKDVERCNKRAKEYHGNQYDESGTPEFAEFFETFHLDEEEIDEDYETLSGWFNDKLGRFGKVGDSLEYGKLTISVLKASAYTVDEFKIVYHPRRIVKED